MKMLCLVTFAILGPLGCVTDEAVAPEEQETSSAIVISPHEMLNATFSDCAEGELCFFTGRNGSGSMCHWNVIDADWTSGAIRCSWATSSNVCSIFNRWSGTIDYYASANFQNHIGSTLKDVASNLACTKLRSHQ